MELVKINDESLVMSHKLKARTFNMAAGRVNRGGRGAEELGCQFIRKEGEDRPTGWRRDYAARLR
jgi:hypothetical protein